jgi:hypothetical protein
MHKSDKIVNDELRKGYYGGNVQIFRMYAPPREGRTYKVYDYNSLYPAVMYGNDFPISKPNIFHFPKNDILNQLGISKAKVISPNNIYLPLLPIRIESPIPSSKLFYPTGKFEGYWDNTFLLKAIQEGYQIDIEKSFIFSGDTIFNDFIKKFYKMKVDNKKGTAKNIIAKLIMNSNYGKWGQKEIQHIMMKGNFNEEEGKLIDFNEDTGWGILEQEGHGKFYFPQISIHVTALAQIKLYDSMKMILDKGYKIFYCDTDAIATDFNKMPVSDKLGDFKIEEEFIWGIFLLPKVYYLDRGTNEKPIKRIKGYAKILSNQINEEAFKKALFKNDYSGFNVSSKTKQLIKIKSSLRRFDSFNVTDYIKKNIHQRYNKRLILQDLNTRPYTFEEIMKNIRKY